MQTTDKVSLDRMVDDTYTTQVLNRFKSINRLKTCVSGYSSALVLAIFKAATLTLRRWRAFAGS